LIAAAGGLAVAAVAAGLLGPALLREGQKLYAPVSAMKRAEADLKTLARDHPWQPPADATLTP
jgi:hypothetical protein